MFNKTVLHPTSPVSKTMISKNNSAPYLSCEQVDDLKGMLDNADSHQLLAVVPPMHHETARQALHNGALGLAEALYLVTP